jgi:AcrR family transcriptional regulator
MIDSEGYARFSIRRLADQLGVTPSTVIHHVGHRPDVLVAAVDAMLREVPQVDPTLCEDWRDAVRLAAASYREVLRRHPRATTLIIDVSRRSPFGIETSMRLLTSLHSGGVPAHRLVETHLALLAFVTGFAIQQSPESLVAVDHPGLDRYLESLADRELADAFGALMPQLQAARSGDGAELTSDAAFSRGLDALIAGLEAPLVAEVHQAASIAAPR